MTETINVPAPEDSRRQFCRRAARWLALAGIGGAAVGLMLRDDGSASVCHQGGACRACAALDGCPLPPALAARSPKEPSQ